MSYRILFKGGIDDMYLDDVRGQQIATKWRNGELRGRIDIEGSVIDAGAIKAILPKQRDPRSNERYEQTDDNLATVNREHEAYRKKRLAMSPKDRAYSISFMNFMCQAIRHRPLTNEEIDEVRAAQEKYFTEHPNAHRMNPTAYFDRHEIKELPARGKTRTIGDIAALQALDVAERVL